MKHIVQFSGGCSSAVAASIVISEHGHNGVVLMWHDTKSEHPDTARFIVDVSKYLKHEITEVSDGRDLWQVIEDNDCLPSQFIPFCTRILKAEPASRFLKTIEGEYTLYNGFGPDEYRRVQRAIARCAPARVVSPCYNKGITSDMAKQIVKSWGIELPRAYAVMTHNNCIPCFKAGKSHFAKVLKHFPCQYQRAVEMEQKIGHTVFKDESLEQLRIRIEKQVTMNFEAESTLPCECWE